MVLVLGYLIALMSFKKAVNSRFYSRKTTAFTILISLGLDLAVISNSFFLMASLLFSWIVFFSILVEQRLRGSNRIFYLTKKFIDVSIGKIAIIFVFTAFLYINWPFITNNFVLYNDNNDLIPSWVKTEGGARGGFENSHNFINETNLYGHGLTTNEPYNSLSLTHLSVNPFCFNGLGIADFAAKKIEGTKFFVNKNTNQLCFIGRLDSGDFPFLLERFPEITRNSFNEKLKLSRDFYSRKLSDSQIEFAKNNSFETTLTFQQFENIFHHHFQYLNPINEFQARGSLKEVNSLYGLTFLPIYWILSTVSLVSYEKFILLVFSSYVVYLMLMSVLAGVIFRSTKLTSLCLMAYAGSLLSLGYVTYFTGLGYSPMRHFFDLFIIYFFYQFLKNNKNYYLVITWVFVISAVVNNLFFGLLILLPFVGILILKAILFDASKPVKLITLAGVVLSICAAYISSVQTKKFEYAEGFLSGMWGFPVEVWKIYSIVFVVILLLIYSIILAGRSRDAVKILFPLFILLYTQSLLIYWIIIPNNAHFLFVLPMAVLTGIAYFYYDDLIFRNATYKKSALILAIFAGLMMFTQSLNSYLDSARDVDNLTKTHQIFNWNFKNAKFKSTLNPYYFENGVNLINKYSMDDVGIYIISPVDSLFLWLSGKSSMMPSMDMMAFLSTSPRQALAVNAIKQNKPRYIYVESCILCDENLIVSSRPPEFLGTASTRMFERAERIGNLRKIFRDIDADYQLIESGPILSVYKRKNT